jgi:hypothetical protein
MECYLVFSTTRKQFDDDEMDLCRAYKESIEGQWSLDEPMQGWPRPAPIIFTWHELQSWEAYGRPLSELLPERYVRTPRALAARSAFIYFEEHEKQLNFEPDSLLI